MHGRRLVIVAAALAAATLIAGCGSEDTVTAEESAQAAALASESCAIKEQALKDTQEGVVPAAQLKANAALQREAAAKANQAAALDPQWSEMAEARTTLADSTDALAALPANIDQWQPADQQRATGLGNVIRDASVTVQRSCGRIETSTAPPTP